MKKTIKSAIDESIRHISIVHLDVDSLECQDAQDLTRMSDGHVDTGDGVLECWGKDDDGGAWRVHLRVKDPAPSYE